MTFQQCCLPVHILPSDFTLYVLSTLQPFLFALFVNQTMKFAEEMGVEFAKLPHGFS